MLDQVVWSAILLYGVAQGLTMAVALLVRRQGRRLSGVLLSSLLVVTCVNLFPWFLVAAGRVEAAPWPAYLSIIFGFSPAPLYYFYARTLMDRGYSPRLGLALAVVLVPGVIRVATFGMGPEAIVAQLELMRSGVAIPVNLTHLLVPGIGSVYAFIFLFLTWRHIGHTAAELRAQFSDEADIHVLWLRVLTVGMAALLFSVVALLVVGTSIGAYTVEMEYAIAALRCLVIQAIAGFAFLRPEALTAPPTDFKIQHQRAPLDRTKADQLAARLRGHIESEKPYRKAGLKLADLAESLNVPAHVLSQVINEEVGVSFFDYINQYRVEEAKALLQQPESNRYTLVAIAAEAGFSSKTAFNRAFKKHARTTPSSYRQHINGESSLSPP